MKYFLDTEFLEGPQEKKFLGFKYGKTPPTIDLISIGIVAEDEREYYAISKDFNLKEAWNRYQMNEDVSPALKYHGIFEEREYWIRDNVLMPIFFELAEREFHDIHFKDEWTYKGRVVTLDIFKSNWKWRSSYKWFKKLINKYGKTNKHIAEEIKQFVYTTSQINDPDAIANWEQIKHLLPIEFYAYYADYDWVVFCWLFGNMIKLPEGFPMYCNDLKQELDRIAINYYDKRWKDSGNNEMINVSNKDKITFVKNLKNYPKENEFQKHNALYDAKWNYELYKFLLSL